MSKLICDICGTSYSDGVDKCPTCGYSRAFEEPASDAAAPVVREKVRGGRFSKKNVRKRLELLAKNGQKSQEPVSAAEMGEELSDAFETEWNRPQQECSVSQKQPETETAAEIPAVQEPAAEPVVLLIPEAEPVPVEETVEESAPAPEPVVVLVPEAEPVPAEEMVAESAPAPEPVVVLVPEAEPVPAEEMVEESAPVPEPVVVLVPEEEPVPAEEMVEEAAPVPEPDVSLVPDEEPARTEEETDRAPVVILLPEEEPVREEAEETAEEAEKIIPMVVPAEIPEESQPVEEEKKKKKGGCLLNVVFYTSLAVFLASAIYLIVMYGVPYLKNVDWPTWPAVETTMPTEEPTPAPTAEPTQAPTDAPTEEPTDPPTEPPTDPPTQAPTDPPTEPPTEAPTEPLLDVKLELNYYDLTFPKKGDVTQLKANIIPNEDITWISDDPSVVTISQTGLITAVGGGRTTVRAVYGDQEVTVKINCRF